MVNVTFCTPLEIENSKYKILKEYVCGDHYKENSIAFWNNARAILKKDVLNFAPIRSNVNENVKKIGNSKKRKINK